MSMIWMGICGTCEGWYTLGECVKHGIPLGNKHVEFQFAHIRATKKTGSTCPNRHSKPSNLPHNIRTFTMYNDREGIE